MGKKFIFLLKRDGEAVRFLITLCTILSCSFSYAQSSTSNQEIDISKKSFKERLAGWYWMALSKDRLSTENQDEPTNSWVNFINLNYKLTKKTSLATIFRFELVDSDQADKFNELDQRISLDSTLYENKTFKVQSWLTAELPTSRGSQEDNRQIRLIPALGLNTKFNDHNNLFAWMAFNKVLYPGANQEVDNTKRHFLTTWIVYTNKYFSNTYDLKLEYSSAIEHIPGASDSSLKKAKNDSLNLGMAFNFSGFNINPYLIHQVSYIKALNTLGGGLQVFKPF